MYLGHALQAGLVTGVLHFNECLRLQFFYFKLSSPSQLYIHSYLLQNCSTPLPKLYFFVKNSPQNFISLSINFMSRGLAEYQDIRKYNNLKIVAIKVPNLLVVQSFLLTRRLRSVTSLFSYLPKALLNAHHLALDGFFSRIL